MIDADDDNSWCNNDDDDDDDGSVDMSYLALAQVTPEKYSQGATHQGNSLKTQVQ